MKHSVENRPSTPEEIDRLLLQLKQEKEALDKLLNFLEQRNHSLVTRSSEVTSEKQDFGQ